jgi:chromosomal replication initiation ATPase DnaA
MRIDLGDTETESYMRARRSTGRLLAALHEHHDARMFVPAGYEKPIPKEPEPDLVEPDEDRRFPLITDIQRAVASHFSISVDDMISSQRTKVFVLPRHIGMYLSRMLTRRSHPQISLRFGRRDHTVCLYAVKKIENLCRSDWTVAHDVAYLEAALS